MRVKANPPERRNSHLQSMPRGNTGRALSIRVNTSTNGSNHVRCKAESFISPDGSADLHDSSSEQQNVHNTENIQDPMIQNLQRHRQKPIQLSQEDVDDIAELCLEVVHDYEAETASFACAASAQRQRELRCQGFESSLEEPTEASQRRARRMETGIQGERNSRRRLDGLKPFAAYAYVRPAFFQDLRLESQATYDTEGAQDFTVPEEDLAMYTRRTVAVLLLAGPSPIRMDDLRKCWLANSQYLRKRNFASQILARTSKIVTSCFGLQLLSFLVRGTKYVVLRQGHLFAPHLRLVRSRREEEIRGFLLFLGVQFLSAQAELHLEVLKSNLRLVGRSDLLQNFDETSLLKFVHFREQPNKFDSLGALLSACEALKYITLTRKSLSASGDTVDAIFIAPTHRLLQELQLEKFLSECRANFGVELPNMPLQPPGADHVSEADA